MRTLTVTSAEVNRQYGELLADGEFFPGENVTNLIIYCTKEIAATAIKLESAGSPVMVELDNGGNAVRVYSHE
jgi:hypothetical protein